MSVVRRRAGRLGSHIGRLGLIAAVAGPLLAGCAGGQTSPDATLGASPPLTTATRVADRPPAATGSVAPSPVPSRTTPQSPPAATATPPSTPTPTATAGPPATAAVPGDFAAELDALIAATPATVGAVVALPDGTVLYQHQADLEFESASLYKLSIMVELYRLREAGLISFADAVVLQPGFFWEGDDVYSYAADLGAAVSIDDLLWAMINVSSNVAAYALLSITGSASIDATMVSLGLNATEIRWDAPISLDHAPEARPEAEPEPDATPAPEASPAPGEPLTPTASPEPSARRAPGDDTAILLSSPPDTDEPDARQRRADAALNVTTPADMARLFGLLLAGQVVSPGASQEMLDLMAGQLINDRLPARLPPGTQVAHKTGNLDDLIHDAGVVYTPSGPVVVVVMADDVLSAAAVIDLMQTIALLAYEVGN